MKKVVILFDGKHYSTSALEFANQLNQKNKILLTGIFLPSIDYTEALMYYAGGWAWPLYIPTIDGMMEIDSSNVDRFKEYCLNNSIEFRVHDQLNERVKDTIQIESRYSDLMLIGGESFYSNLGEVTQYEYVEDVILRAECPTVVLPEHYTPLQNLIFAHKGNHSSVFALKQFSYILPEFCDLPVNVVYISTKNDDMPDMEYLTELCGRHFSDLTFMKLEADEKKYLNTWLENMGKSMVIAGSYSREWLFRKHFVEDVIREHKLPVFISHV